MWEELLPAKNVAYKLGIKLRLNNTDVEAITNTYTNPEQCFLQIIVKFLHQHLTPTRKTITDALESPFVNLPQLERAIKASHLPNMTPPPAPRTGEGKTSLSIIDYLCIAIYMAVVERGRSG